MQLIIGGAPVNTAHGCCYVCRHFSNPKEWVDTGVDVDFEGGLVLCGNCARSIAQIIGYLPPDSIEKLKEANTKLRQSNKELKAKADAYDLFIKALEESRESLV